jgi:hypothetical protein
MSTMLRAASRKTGEVRRSCGQTYSIWCREYAGEEEGKKVLFEAARRLAGGEVPAETALVDGAPRISTSM